MSHENKSREEDDSRVPRKYNKSEGGSKCAKGGLCNEYNSDSYNDINEEMGGLDKMRESIFSN